MQSKLIAIIMACGMTFATFPLGVQADNYNIDFSVENPTEYLLNSKACKESEDEEDVSLMSDSNGTLLAVFDGEGTKENPFILSTPQHFQYLAVLVNTGNSLYKSAYYRLGNSIDFSGVNGYIPIGKVISLSISPELTIYRHLFLHLLILNTVRLMWALSFFPVPLL